MPTLIGWVPNATVTGHSIGQQLFTVTVTLNGLSSSKDSFSTITARAVVAVRMELLAFS